MNNYLPPDAACGILSHNDVLLTPSDAAKESGCSIETIRCAYRSGDLRAYQPTKNGRVKIPRSALLEWLRRPASRGDRLDRWHGVVATEIGRAS